MEMFLLAGAALVLIGVSFKQTKQSLKDIAAKHRAQSILPKAVSVLILTAHASELIKVVEHASIVNITAALLFLVIVLASRPGTEGELH
jgi:nitrate reductase gamma subunit